MKIALFYAGLLMAACGTVYAGSQNGQLHAQLIIVPSCGIIYQSSHYQMKCNVADTASVPQPKITESRIPLNQANLSAPVPLSTAKTTPEIETRLITVEW